MKVDRALVDRLDSEVVGRRRELELLVAALAADRHMLLEGPPGTGKSTVLRSLADATGAEFVFVEGDAELTPSRFVGTFDPAQVLADGYSADAFVDGPLITALRDGALLYVEEINRVPEETLNVLITVMSEGELHVPRLGRVGAAEGFRLVAAMNPFDSVGTARISARDLRPHVPGHHGLPGRGHRDPDRACVRCRAPMPIFVGKVVNVVRATRVHPGVRIGSSVRGAIDLVLLAVSWARSADTPEGDYHTGLDAALAALSGRLRVYEGGENHGDDIVRDLWAAEFGPPPGAGEGDPGKG